MLTGDGRFSRLIVLSLDLVIVAIALFVIWRVAEGTPARRSMSFGPALEISRSLNSAPIKWSYAPMNVVLYLSTACPGCNDPDSIALYRQIVSIATSKADSVHVRVWSLQPANEMKEWLARHSIGVDSIVQLPSPDRLGLIVTPTLLIVNNIGTITDVVEGSLRNDETMRLWQRLAGNELQPLNRGRALFQVSEEEYLRYWRAGNSVLLDVRDRNTYMSSHDPNAVNIPADEVALRAPAELSKAKLIVIDCRFDVLPVCMAARSDLEDAGFPVPKVLVLQETRPMS